MQPTLGTTCDSMVFSIHPHPKIKHVFPTVSFWGPHSVMLKAYFCLCTQGSLLEELPRTICNNWDCSCASILPTPYAISLIQCFAYFWKQVRDQPAMFRLGLFSGSFTADFSFFLTWLKGQNVLWFLFRRVLFWFMTQTPLKAHLMIPSILEVHFTNLGICKHPVHCSDVIFLLWLFHWFIFGVSFKWYSGNLWILPCHSQPCIWQFSAEALGCDVVWSWIHQGHLSRAQGPPELWLWLSKVGSR